MITAVRTYTGLNFDPLTPDPSAVSIKDIAHSLAMTCRFNGHCRDFYSVAQHSVHVAALLPERLKLWGLLHDAAEAYLGDVIRPLKPFFRVHNLDLDRLEAEVLACIAQALELPTPLRLSEWHEILLADNRMLAHEARDLMGDPQDWPELPVVPPSTPPIHCWPPAVAKTMFLSRYEAERRRLAAPVRRGPLAEVGA